MAKRTIRVVKWLGTAPAVAVCTNCAREFPAPVGTLRRTSDAQANLQEQFDRHKCKTEDPGPISEEVTGGPKEA
jgi:hypothetical protein